MIHTPTFAELLARSGKSMSRIARESGISISMVSRVASGDRIPSLSMVFKLASAIGVHPSTMLEAFNQPESIQKAA